VHVKPASSLSTAPRSRTSTTGSWRWWPP